MIALRRRSVVFILLSAMFAALAAWMFMRRAVALERDLGEYVPVVVAARAISPRTPIQPADLSTIQVPRRFALPTYFASPSQVTGTVSLTPILEGDVVTRSMVRPADKLPQKTRPVVLRAGSNSKVVFDLTPQPGDRVDVFASYTAGQEHRTEMVLQDAEIVSVGEENRGRQATIAVPLDRVELLIRMQNYADEVRVLRHQLTE